MRYRHILENLFNMRQEWLNEKMATSAYAEGWNACNKVWLASLAALLKGAERQIERLENK